MDLIADSGSTKTDWVFLEKSEIIARVQTKGINPFFRDTEDIFVELEASLFPVKKNVDRVYFYGAGIVNDEKGQVVKDALQKLYGNIPVETYSDIIGAARASCGDTPGIVCIMGTGSNACVYNGEQVVENIPPLGYILGDEGSGTSFGKTLLGDYFKYVMPVDVRSKFQKRFKIDKDEVLNRVYRQPAANKYLAGFSHFLSEEINNDYCRKVIRDNFYSFVIRNILQLSNVNKYPVYFVGSIAHHFKPILEEVLKTEKLLLGGVVKDPIEGLSDYYSRKNER